jgi:hypothetical protein
VAAKIVHDDDVAWGKRGPEALLDIVEENLAVDRPVDDAGRCKAIAAQSSKERQGMPPPVGDLGDKALALGTTSVPPCHVGFGPGLVDEDEPPGINAALVLLPLCAPARPVGPILLGGVQAFF